MKRSYVIATIFLGALCLITMLKPGSAAINYEKELMPDQFHVEYFEYSNNTEADAAKSARTHLVLFAETQKISFVSENLSSLFILNETQMLRFVNGTSHTAKKTWANITSVEEELTYQKLVGEWGIESYLFNKTAQDPEAKPYRYAAMYFVVLNEANATNSFGLRVGYKNEFLIFLEDLFRVVVTFVFFLFGAKLLLDARQARKEKQVSKTHMYKNYGIGLFFGGLTTFIWEVYHWYARLDPAETWLQPLVFNDMPDVPIFSKNILSFVTFMALGFSIMFMSNTVEKMVQNKKIPIFTYILLVMELLMIGCIFFPSVFIYVFYPWVIALGLDAANVLITYLRVAHMTTGDLKKQAMSIMFYLLFLYLCISLVRTLVVPEWVGNILSSFFIIGLYKNLTMHETRAQESIKVSA